MEFLNLMTSYRKGEKMGIISANFHSHIPNETPTQTNQRGDDVPGNSRGRLVAGRFLRFGF